MKKTNLVLLALLVSILMIAAIPVPVHRISGTLRYNRASTCMVPDYVALPVMENVYLKGVGFPTHGQFQGCRINALGKYLISSSNSQCKVFEISNAVIICPSSRIDLITH